MSLNYLGLNDRIELIVVQQSPLAFQYNNIDKYRVIGAFMENEMYVGNLKAQLGASIQGISKVLKTNNNNKDDFLFNLQLNANLSYTLPKWNTTLSTYFKYINVIFSKSRSSLL